MVKKHSINFTVGRKFRIINPRSTQIAEIVAILTDEEIPQVIYKTKDRGQLELRYVCIPVYRFNHMMTHGKRYQQWID